MPRNQRYIAITRDGNELVKIDLGGRQAEMRVLESGDVVVDLGLLRPAETVTVPPVAVPEGASSPEPKKPARKPKHDIQPHPDKPKKPARPKK